MTSLRHFLFLFAAVSLTGLACGDDKSSPDEDGGTTDSGTAQDGAVSGDGGGAADGGPATDRCDEARNECGACVLDDAPETEADCRCTACPVFPATLRECQTRQSQYNRVCADWFRSNPCPAVLCVEPPEAICVAGTCQLANEMR